MRIISKVVFLLAFFFISQPLSADGLSDKVLQDMLSNIDSFGDYSVTFTLENGGQAINGYCLVSNDKYNMKIGDLSYIGDGRTVYLIGHNFKEVVIDHEPQDETSVLNNPAHMFNFASLQLSSQLLEDEQAFNGRLCYHLILKDLTGTKDFNQIDLWIDKYTNNPVQIAYNLKGMDDRIVIMINNIQPETIADRSVFAFDPSRFTDYEIIDFR